MTDLLPDTPRLRPENHDDDLSWMDNGHCRELWALEHANRNGYPTVLDMMFPNRGAATAPAQQVCAECPVREQCREYAIAEPPIQGIWGGTSARERQRIRTERGLPPAAHIRPEPARCGTHRGYEQHRADGTPICEMCAAAKRRSRSRAPGGSLR